MAPAAQMERSVTLAESKHPLDRAAKARHEAGDAPINVKSLFGAPGSRQRTQQ
jgi:hypothetical protein